MDSEFLSGKTMEVSMADPFCDASMSNLFDSDRMAGVNPPSLTINPSDLLDEVRPFVPEDLSLATTSLPIRGAYHAESKKKSKRFPEAVEVMEQVRSDCSKRLQLFDMAPPWERFYKPLGRYLTEQLISWAKS